MSFFNFFKKSPKKEPDKNSVFGDPELQKVRYDAAMEFVKVFQEKIPLMNGRPHPGTVLSAAARIAGTSLYRSMNYKNDAAPGTVVLSDEVNKAWPPLMDLFAFYCKKNGIDIKSKPLVTEFPEKDKPLMTVEQVQAEYQDQYNAIMKKYGLDYLDGARAGMIFCSIIFQYHCGVAKDIDPYVGAGIIAMGIVEGAKTTPPPFGTPQTQIHTAEKSDRLVLGDIEVAAREATKNGGVFIQIPPAALEMLKRSNLDPYMIYEQGLIKQIDARIPRIDFVEANVDVLFDEWKSKQPETQIPIHVRLIIWLKKNASAHGYTQKGNSWIRN
jgi:hypothetical protein